MENYDPGNENLIEPKLTGEVLATTVLNFLKTNALNTNDCIAISTDGCSVMTSERKGAVATLQKSMPQTIYCPCFNHCLNLSLLKGNTVQEVRNTFGRMSEIINFFNASSKRQFVLKKHLHHSLHTLCDTRWVERYDCILQFESSLKSIVLALEEISEWDDASSSKAATLKNAINCQFIITLKVIAPIFSFTLPLSRLLQKVNLDKLKAAATITETIQKLENIREEIQSEFQVIFKEACTVISSLNICRKTTTCR